MQTLITVNGTKVWADDRQVQAIRTLEDTRKGGAASVTGYRPESNWTVRPTQNIQFLSRISTMNLYKRRIAALEALKYEDVAKAIAADPKLAAAPYGDMVELFEARKQMAIDSLQKTLDGDRSDAHRQAHDRCYVKVTEGVKLHLVTDKGPDGTKVPRLMNGHPIVASIMITALFLNVKTIVEGERKVVNSGLPVRMSNVIEKAIATPGNTLKTLSLKSDNFESVHIDGETILSEDFKRSL